MSDNSSIIDRTSILRIAGITIGILLVLAGGSSLVSAVEANDPILKEEITISPAVEQIKSEPGEIVNGKFTVFNSGEKPFSYIVYARPYSVETEMYSPNYEDTSDRSNLYRWVQFDTTEGKLEPGEQKEINYTILIPDNAESGGHYGVIFAETVADESDQQMIARNKRVGSILRLSAGGDVKNSGKVESQSINWLQTRPPMTAEALISNSGNVDFDARSTMRVTTIFGRELYNAKADHVIYPDKPRMIATPWEGSATFGLFKVEQSLEVLGETSSESSYVLMMPRWTIMVLAMAIVGGGAYVAYRRLL